MERRVWRRPLTMVQKFEANEYVAACAYGVCNMDGYVFHDRNGNGRIDSEDDYIYYNEACESQFIVQGVDSTMPDNNVLVFREDQIEWEGGLIFGTWVVKDWHKDKGTPAFWWDDHVTTEWNPDPDRPNHS